MSPKKASEINSKKTFKRFYALHGLLVNFGKCRLPTRPLTPTGSSILLGPPQAGQKILQKAGAKPVLGQASWVPRKKIMVVCQ
jgi:hypothetical protein